MRSAPWGLRGSPAKPLLPKDPVVPFEKVGLGGAPGGPVVPFEEVRLDPQGFIFGIEDSTSNKVLVEFVKVVPSMFGTGTLIKSRLI